MVISVRISRRQEQLLRRFSKQQAASRSELLRTALEAFCQGQLALHTGHHPYRALARWIGCAHSGRGDLAANAHQYAHNALHAKPRAR